LKISANFSQPQDVTVHAKRAVIVYDIGCDSPCTDWLAILTDTHQQLLRSILKDKTVRSKITAEQRSAIRQICVELIPVHEPEKVLLAFKSALAAAAHAENIPYSIERTAVLSQVVSVFIDELYATGEDADVQEMHLRRETRATAPRLILDNDSISTRL
jgi:hypothetical protein